MNGYRDSDLSRSAYYRRLKRARELGCTLDEVPDGRGKHGNHVRGPAHPCYGIGLPVNRWGKRRDGS